jgi:hypothetical protein
LSANAFKSVFSVPITACDKVEDYWQIKFADGACLNIYNALEIVPPEREPSVSHIGSSVVCVDENVDSISINLSDGAKLVVGMRDDDFNGPEAITLYLSSGQIIAWS